MAYLTQARYCLAAVMSLYARLRPLPFLGLLLALVGCGREELAPVPKAAPAASKFVEDLARFLPKQIGLPPTARPWIAHVKPVDLDHDGLMDLLVVDAGENTLTWLRQKSPGEFEEIIIADHLPAPVQVSVADMTGSGHLDLLVACMGEVYPNNDKIGSVLIFQNDGHQHFTKHIIADHICRVTDVQAADINHDGKLDLVLAQFGYDQGEVQWMENLGNWQFRSHHLLELSGPINVCVADFSGTGHPDIAANFSQQWEEIILFQNDGTGNFTHKVLWGSTNEDWASSNMTVCDLNGDGRPDLLFSNGDGFGPTTQPGPRPWHGVNWLENLGGGFFRYHRVGDLAGCFSPVAVDLDGDGLMDVVAVSAFNDWTNPQAQSLVWFRQEKNGTFTPHVLAHVPTHLLTLAAVDLDNSGKPSLVTGAFFYAPPYTELSRVLWWKRTGISDQALKFKP